MWLWGSNTEAPKTHLNCPEERDEDIQSMDDDFDRISQCSRSNCEDDFFLVPDSEEVKRLRESVEHLSNLVSTLEVKNIELENAKKLRGQEIEFKDRLVQSKETQMGNLRKEAKQTENKINAEVRKLNETIESLKTQVLELAKENRKIGDEAAGLRRCEQEKNQECKSLESSNGRLKEQLKAKADAITQLNEEVNLLNSKIAALERDARGHKAAAAAAAAAEKAASDMMTIDALHHESLEVVAQRQNIAELARSRQKENDLVNENTVLKAEVLKCRLDLAASAEEVNLQGIRVNDLQKQISELHMLRDQLQRELANANASLGEQSDKMKANIIIQSREIQQCREKEAEWASESKSMNDAMQRLTEEMEGLAIQLRAAQDEAACLRGKLTDSTRQTNKLRDQLDHQTQRMERMQKEVDQITSQVDSSTIPSHVAAESALQNKYKAEMCRIMQENPNCIPIRCVRAVDCTPAYGLLEKKKFAAPKDMTLSRFNEHIRQKLQLHPDEPLSVYVDTSIPRPSSEALEDIHNVCKGLDGFLHLKYSHSSDHVP
jgi:chromosome segregation ATPase|uniref:Autophagy-related protein n=1 Tax=Eutreptiella gymnastica TaxID=73025 RepID=A0A7S4CNF3_9EUGL